MRWETRRKVLPTPEILPNPRNPEAMPSLRALPMLCVLRDASIEVLYLAFRPNPELQDAQDQLAEWIRDHEEAGTPNEYVDWSTAPKVDWAAYHKPESYRVVGWSRPGSSWGDSLGETVDLDEVLCWAQVQVPLRISRRLAKGRA